jgi:ABC-type ATPase with predicted acetyltransferase domain
MGSAVEMRVALPGRVVLRPGCARDYKRLSRFHYRGKRPATWAGVWVAEYFGAMDSGTAGRVVAVGVLSYPTLALHSRDEVLGLHGMTERDRIEFVNTHVRTISRVVVHPQFRAAGLAAALVRCLIDHCETRYVEALAVMGRAHPFFEKAGMRRVDRGDGRPVYYWCERGEERTRVTRLAPR